MKLLWLSLFMLLPISSYSADRVSVSQNYFCQKLGINLPKFPGRFTKWTRTQRKGCLVEDPKIEEHDDVKKSLKKMGITLSEDPKIRNQQAVCACLRSKSRIQEKLYEWHNKKTDWVEDIAWKKMGDHFKGKLFEQFSSMLQMDVLLQRGDVNENFMMYAPHCRLKSVTEKLTTLRDNKKDCPNTKLFDRRMRLILGTKSLDAFQKNFEKRLSKVVKNELSEDDIKNEQCLSYKGYLSTRSPSSLRYEILDEIRFVKSKHQGDKKALNSALNDLYLKYNKEYVTDLKSTTSNPLYNEDYLNTTLGKSATYGDLNEKVGSELKEKLNSGRHRAKRRNNELQGDPFLFSLLNDKTFFRKFAKRKSPQLGFHDLKNLKKVFKDQDTKCKDIIQPELLNRMFCQEAPPAMDMDMIQKDIGPEITYKADADEGHFGAKVNEYLAAKFLCNPKKKKVEGVRKKQRWTPKKLDFTTDSDLLFKTLNPKNRMLSDLEILDMKKSGDTRLKGHETEFERINRQMCPMRRAKCIGTNMKSKSCNHVRHVVGGSPSRNYTLENFSMIKFGKDEIKLTKEEAEALKKELDSVIQGYKKPFTVLGLREELQQKLAEMYAKVISEKTGKEFKPPIHIYHTDFPHDLVMKVHNHVKVLVDSHVYSYGRNTTMQNRRDMAAIEIYGDKIKEYFSSLPANEGQIIIKKDEDITPELIAMYAKSQGTTRDDLLTPHYENAPEGSRIKRAMVGSLNDKIVSDESTQGQTGTNYFTDYNLAATQDQQDQVQTYRDNLGDGEEDTNTSLTWAPDPPCFGKTCHDNDGDIITNSDDNTSSGVPYNRTVNTDPSITTGPVITGGDNVDNGTNGGNGNDGDNRGTPRPVVTPIPRVIQSNDVVATNDASSFSNPDASFLNIGGKSQVYVPNESNQEIDLNDNEQIQRKDTFANDSSVQTLTIPDENDGLVARMKADAERDRQLEELRRVRDDLKIQGSASRNVIKDIRRDRFMDDFSQKLNSSNAVVNSPNTKGTYTSTYGVSTDSSKKSDFNHIQKTGQLPGSKELENLRGPAAANTSAGGGSTGLKAKKGLSGISGGALGSLANGLNLKDPDVMKALLKAKIQLQAESVFPYQLVKEMGIEKVVSTFALEGQSFYALEISDFNFTLHKIDISENIMKDGGLTGKRKELLASLHFLRGVVGSEETFKKIQNSYEVSSSKKLSTNDEKKDLFLKTMTYEELDKLLVVAVHKELKIEK
ncbi:MAG: hypothetical protein KC493_11880 [Bacteriovoracaceae bacterium]|nr:hypothetical protein [Bacteriovoracaceae bacterium]